MTKKKNNQRIGVLTGGGDCPGLNAALRAVVKTVSASGAECWGIEEGFLGLHERKLRLLHDSDVSGVLGRGGTLLRSSRFNPFKEKKILKTCVDNFHRQALTGLIVIGGNGSLAIANDFQKSGDLPVIGIPKTIDNDVPGTDLSIGFMTAVSTAMEAIDRLHTTAESHNFVMIVEVMGRHCGWLALEAGLASGADAILIPEQRTKLEELVKCIHERQKRGKNFSILVVAEDACLVDSKGKVLVHTDSIQDEYGHIKKSGAGTKIAAVLHENTGLETRCTVLGHVQRGGSPVAFDRLLATRMGCLAGDLALQKKWGRLTAYRQGAVKSMPLSLVAENLSSKAQLEELKLSKRFAY